MEIKFSPCTSILGRYPFELALISNRIYILKESEQAKVSLTNNIEEPLNHIVMALFGKHNEFKFYQLGPDGLFKLDFGVIRRMQNLTRSTYPLEVCNVKWEFITKDLTAFMLLYAQDDNKLDSYGRGKRI